MIAIYTLAALPFFTGGAVISLAISRLTQASTSCMGPTRPRGHGVPAFAAAPQSLRRAGRGVALAAVLGSVAALLFTPASAGRTARRAPPLPSAFRGGAQFLGTAPFDVARYERARRRPVLFSKWNSFSRVGVYDRRTATGR